MRLYSILTMLLLLYSCTLKEKEMSTEQLIKAEWIKYAPGIYYINTGEKNTRLTKNDSVILELKTISPSEDLYLEDKMAMPEESSIAFITDTLKKNGFPATKGYLKINPLEMLKAKSGIIIAYLDDMYNAGNEWKKDSTGLAAIPGIKYLRFFSKEEAKKKYLKDDNADWSNILTENPLPPSIEIDLFNTEISEKEMELILSKIKELIPALTDIDYPRILFEKSNSYAIYKFKKL